jgi:hypothetical protein
MSKTNRRRRWKLALFVVPALLPWLACNGSGGAKGGGVGGGSAATGGSGAADAAVTGDTGGKPDAGVDVASATGGQGGGAPGAGGQGGRATGQGGARGSDAGASPDAGVRPDGSSGPDAVVSPQGFIHPGLLLGSSDIARMKDKIAARSEPWLTSYNTLLNNASSSATKAVNTPPPIIGRNAASAFATTRYAAEADAVTAYQNALVFVLTGQTAHADETVKILNAYARGTQHFDSVDPERDLEAAILGWLWVSSAELIRYSGQTYAGWAAADVSVFNTWIRNVVYADTAYNPIGVLVTPLPNGAGARGAFGLRTKIAIGVYLDDRTIYDQAVTYFFSGQGNGAPQYYVNPVTGQTWESGRDQGHAQGGLSRLVETAHIAHNQGNETLYAWGNNGLLRAVEYIASYNLGNDVPYAPMQPFTLSFSAVYTTISADGRGAWQPIYELPYHYFHDIKGLAMPFALQAIAAEVTETLSPQNDNPMFATLAYRQ